MSKFRRLSIISGTLIAVLLISIIILAFTFPGIGWVLGIAIGGGCDSSIKQELKSPDNVYVVKVISRDCGALATGQTYVEVKKQSAFASSKAVFEISGPDHDKEISLHWEAPTKLRINYEGYISEVLAIEYSVRDLVIETYAREKVLTEQYIRKAGDEGDYIKLIDYNGRPSPVPNPPESTK
jgi:hypothetical protein